MLKNELNREEAIKKLVAEKEPRVTLSFYRYVKIEDPQSLRNQLFKEWSALGVLGRIYLATEGINSQMSVPESKFEKFRENLYSLPGFNDIPFKIAVEDGLSFWKLTIKIRKQIVADGLPADSYDLSNIGQHLNAEQWNEAMQDPNAVVVDMRNHYESRIGKFDGAITPEADLFKEELPMVSQMLKGKEDKKVLLYCTGGVRCEKASAYLKHQGFKNVSQLYGGIIYYAHEVKEKALKSRFLGKNFVFDGRTAEAITNDVISKCDICQFTSDRTINCANETCNLLFIECEDCAKYLKDTCSTLCLLYTKLPEPMKKLWRKMQKPTDLKIYKSRIRPENRKLTFVDRLFIRYLQKSS